MVKTLLVDDEESILKLLSTVLGMHGFSVQTATSAEEAVSLLARNEYDVVLTDLRMESPLAGFDVVGAANRSVPRPAIVVLTAFPVPPAEWQGAGADTLYMKGTNTLFLPDQLKVLLAQKEHSSGNQQLRCDARSR